MFEGLKTMICAETLKTPALKTARVPAGVTDTFFAKKAPDEPVFQSEIVFSFVFENDVVDVLTADKPSVKLLEATSICNSDLEDEAKSS